jgi:glycosyltransferase involved in cell wall biosynthesis
MEYAVVIPAKNEAEHLAKTLTSLVQQQQRPLRCLVMNDGSTDATGDIASSYAHLHPFIMHHRMPASEGYTLGGKVVRVFNQGKRMLDEAGIPYEVIVKLDADTSFSDGVISELLRLMEQHQLGIASGTPFYVRDGRKTFDYSPDWHSHGQFKLYRRETLERIGGLRESLGWDTADNIQAMDSGWPTRAFREVHYEMHRQVGGKQSLVRGRRNHGRGAFLLGYDPAYFALRMMHDLLKPPLVVGSFSMLRGYLDMPSTQPPLLTPRQQRLLRRLLWQGLSDRLRRGDFALLQRLKVMGH